MFPLNVVMIGCDLDLTAELHTQLSRMSAVVEAELQTPAELEKVDAADASKARLWILPVTTLAELESAKRLKSRLPNWPAVLLINANNDSALVLAAIRVGGFEVASMPIDEQEFQDALDRIATQFDRRSSLGKVVAISGVAGGAGATTTAINVATIIAREHNKRVVLAEMSSQLGMVATYLNVKPRFSIVDLQQFSGGSDLNPVRSILTELEKNLTLLSGPRLLLPGQWLAPSDVRGVLKALRRLSDVVIVDLTCSFDDRYFELLKEVDHLVLLGEQTIPSIRSLIVLWNAAQAGGPQTLPAERSVVINRYRPNVQGFQLVQLEERIGHKPILPITNDYQSAQEALNRGKSILDECPNSPIVADTRLLAAFVLGVGIETANQQQQGWFSRVFKRGS